MNKFIITSRNYKSVHLTIRIEKRIQDGFNNLAKQSRRTRNELINIALDFALENAKIMLDNKEVR